MAKYREKSETVDAFTFDELVQYAKDLDLLERDEKYFFLSLLRSPYIVTITSETTCKVERTEKGCAYIDQGQILVVSAHGSMTVWTEKGFREMYEEVK